MKAVYGNGHAFLVGSGGVVFSPGQFTASRWRRYLAAFDQLLVIGHSRVLAEDDPRDRLNVASAARVRFAFVPPFKTAGGMFARRGRAQAVIDQAVGQADVVIARLPSEIGLMTVGAAQRLGRPYAVEVSGCVWDGLWYHGSRLGRLYAPLARWRVRRCIRSAPHVHYVTRNFLQRRYPTEGRSVGISNVEVSPPLAEVLERRLARIDQPSGAFVIGLIGSIGNELKGIRTALEALGRAKERLPRFELRILGPGDPQRWASLVEAAGLATEVRFCGALPGGDPVLQWLDEVDLYLQPSFREGLPRATVEAMSRACPVIASTAGGLPELLPDGCLHRPGDAAQLALLVGRIALDRRWQATCARQNFVTARRFTSDVLEPQRQRFWRTVADSVASNVGGAAPVLHGIEIPGT